MFRRPKCKAAVAPAGPAPIMRTGYSVSILQVAVRALEFLRVKNDGYHEWHEVEKQLMTIVH
jgi:hypothetical protein